MAYSKVFYRIQREGSLHSAAHVVPLIIDLIQPRSVIDVGCGTGTWLSVFLRSGVADIVGVDGAYVAKDMLLIPPEKFRVQDLNQAFHCGRRFDVAMSLEVAEHLRPAAARGLVESLTMASPVVMFSAAIPGQGGVHHVNEQWPDYWRELFETRDYVVVDCLRDAIWDNPEVEVWYRQNLLLFVERNYLNEHPRLKKLADERAGRFVSVVHPEMFKYRLTKPGFFEAVGRLPASVRTGLRRCMGRPY